MLLRVWSRRISHHSKTSLNPRHRTRPKSWFILPFRGCGWGRWGHQIFRHAAWGRYWPQVYVASSVQVTFLKIFFLKKLNQFDLFSLLQKTINQINFENKVMFDFKWDKCKGQLISKCPFGVIVWTKIPIQKISEISALASKERSNQKLY